MKTLKELFEQNPNIVINTDIDGFLSGMILQHYYGCNIVGFSNSRESVWVTPDVKSIDDPVYIDIYVNRPHVVCIDQHIIAFNRAHHNRIASWGTKQNPNLDRGRTFCGDDQGDYYHKYPFGTVHYLMALMGREGIHVKFNALGVPKNIMGHSVCPGQVLLRADDALYSTLSPYRENALDWWEWLDPQHCLPAIIDVKAYLATCEIPQAKQYKEAIGLFFKSQGCDGIDGAFKTIVDRQGRLLDKVVAYAQNLQEIMGLPLRLPTHYIAHLGKYAIIPCSPSTDMSILNDDRLYSYAFIYGPHSRYPNFSYTTDMQD